MNLFTESIRVELLTNSWRHHSESELILLDDLGGDSLKVDKITEFSVRIPELRNVIDRVGDCFRWFTISNKRTKETNVRDSIKDAMTETLLLDGLLRQVKLL